MDKISRYQTIDLNLLENLRAERQPTPCSIAESAASQPALEHDDRYRLSTVRKELAKLSSLVQDFTDS